MYTLNDPIEHPDYTVTITDEQYEELPFWKKWKYSYFSGYVNNIQSTPTQSTNGGTDFIDDLLLADLLLNNDNQSNGSDNQTFNNDVTTPEPVHFGGGDFGGAGASGTWDNGTQNQTNDGTDIDTSPNFS